MKKYSVGDVVMVPCTIVEIHAQGFKGGLHANGGPNIPGDVEQPAQIIASTPDAVSFDSIGRAHFKADIAL